MGCCTWTSCATFPRPRSRASSPSIPRRPPRADHRRCGRGLRRPPERRPDRLIHHGGAASAAVLRRALDPGAGWVEEEGFLDCPRIVPSWLPRARFSSPPACSMTPPRTIWWSRGSTWCPPACPAMPSTPTFPTTALDQLLEGAAGWIVGQRAVTREVLARHPGLAVIARRGGRLRSGGRGGGARARAGGDHRRRCQ